MHIKQASLASLIHAHSMRQVCSNVGNGSSGAEVCVYACMRVQVFLCVPCLYSLNLQLCCHCSLALSMPEELCVAEDRA